MDDEDNDMICRCTKTSAGAAQPKTLPIIPGYYMNLCENGSDYVDVRVEVQDRDWNFGFNGWENDW